MKQKYVDAFMDMAVRFGQTSTAKRLKVGCLIFKNEAIVSCGTNGQPPKWPTEVCEDGDGNTLPTVRHAEAAALDKIDVSAVQGASVFVSHSPCLTCAQRLVDAGVTTVYYRYEYRSTEGIEHLRKSGVIVFKVEEE